LAILTGVAEEEARAGSINIKVNRRMTIASARTS